MELEQAFSATRRDCGRHVEFQSTLPEVVGEIRSSLQYDSGHIYQKTGVLEVDTTSSLSVTIVGTRTKQSVSRGMTHSEGGWPREVDPEASVELINRLRGRMLRDDNILPAVEAAAEKLDYCVNQNLAVDVYERYFGDDISSSESHGDGMYVQESTTFNDPSVARRPAVCLSWSPTDEARIACGYSKQDFFSLSSGESIQGYVWNINHPIEPESELVPQSPVRAIAFQSNGQQILCGSRNGVLSLFDTRKGSHPISTSSIDSSHHEPVRQIEWLNKSTGFEAVSVSTDGCLCFWDTRRLNYPTTKIALRCPPIALNRPRGAKGGVPGGGARQGMSADSLSQMVSKVISAEDYNTIKRYSGNTLPGTCLAVDPRIKESQEILCGTEMGLVFKCNGGGGDGKNDWSASKESGNRSITGMYIGHISSVLSIERNKFLPDVFLTAGDWCSKVWGKKLALPVRSTSFQTHQTTVAKWSPTKAGMFFSTDTMGDIKAWDYETMHLSPIYEKRVSSSSIASMSIRPDGKFAVVGDVSGRATVLNFSDGLSQAQKNGAKSFEEELGQDISSTIAKARRSRNVETSQKYTGRVSENSAMSESLQQWQDMGSAEEVLEFCGRRESMSAQWQQALDAVDMERVNVEVDHHYFNLFEGKKAESLRVAETAPSVPCSSREI